MSIDAIKARLQTVLPTGSLRARFASGVFWSLAGATIAQGLTFLATVVNARWLGKAGYGELGMVMNTVGMFGVFAGLGLGLTATKYVAEFRVKRPERAGRIIGMSILVALATAGFISVLLFFFAPFLAMRTLNAPHLTTGLRIACGMLFFSSIMGTLTGTLAGFESFKLIAIVNTFQGLCSFPLAVAGVYFWQLNGALCGYAAAAALGCAASGIALRVEMRKTNVSAIFRDIGKELSILWEFALPSLLSGVMVGPVMWAVRVMLVKQPNGYAEMGVFSAATTFQTFLYLLEYHLSKPFLPMLSSRDGEKNVSFNRANILLSWLIGVIPSIPLICFPEILSLVFGAQFGGAASQKTLVLVLCFTCIVMYKQGLARVLAANNLLWWGFLSNGIWAVILIVSSFFLVKYGSMGLAASFVIAYALNTSVFVPFYVSRKLAPRETMLSKESALIWLVIGSLSSLTFLSYSLKFRAVAFAMGVLFLFFAFFRIVFGEFYSNKPTSD